MLSKYLLCEESVSVIDENGEEIEYDVVFKKDVRQIDEECPHCHEKLMAEYPISGSITSIYKNETNIEPTIETNYELVQLIMKALEKQLTNETKDCLNRKDENPDCNVLDKDYSEKEKSLGLDIDSEPS